jgi:hypothetical protein
MQNLGTVKPGSTVYIYFDTFAGSTGAPITLTGLATSDILVYKDGGTTQRASASGFTLLDTDGIDFDGLTGIHGVSISLADNTTADFWAAGSDYTVVIGDVTIDSQTVRFAAARFRIGYPGATLDTTIATLASQTSFTLTAGPADDNALNGWIAVVHDAASAVQIATGVVNDYTGSTKTVTLAADPGIFTMAAKDNISFFPPVGLKAVAGSVATATNSAQIDFTATTGTSTTSVKMTTGSMSTVADEFADRFLIHVASGEMRTVTASADTAGVTALTVGAFTAAASGDAFILVGSSLATRA